MDMHREYGSRGQRIVQIGWKGRLWQGMWNVERLLACTTRVPQTLDISIAECHPFNTGYISKLELKSPHSISSIGPSAYH